MNLNKYIEAVGELKKASLFCADVFKDEQPPSMEYALVVGAIKEVEVIESIHSFKEFAKFTYEDGYNIGYSRAKEYYVDVFKSLSDLLRFKNILYTADVGHEQQQIIIEAIEGAERLLKFSGLKQTRTESEDN